MGGLLSNLHCLLVQVHNPLSNHLEPPVFWDSVFIDFRWALRYIYIVYYVIKPEIGGGSEQCPIIKHMDKFFSATHKYSHQVA